MLDYKYIEQLLSRYFEATATLQEEQILKAFFAQEDEEMPVALRRYKGLFDALGQDETLGADFDERMLGLIGHETDTAAHAGTAVDDAEAARQAEPVKARVISLHERFRPLLRAAAAVAVILTLSTAINQSFSDGNVWTDEDQIARYQDEMRKAAIAAATSDSTLLFTEGISLKTDTLLADTLMQKKTGYIE